ncbi:hypothetical protein N0B31_19605 [Salinirubellus salinus]|uniref:Lipoprotein n=1 Tax=Salinirubellus salinus TaxID=1364945 RepID=A0A9E7R443_9EURY|nr:hypothetical protein [Salinirubellus salinus]UWM54310.1 hypothetical protein N0B31_19605 [Salinirubellus salinus]
MYGLSRRRVLLGAAAAATTGLAGCTGGDEPAGTGDGGGGGSTPTATAASGGGGDAGTLEATPMPSADPDCSRLTGSPTPYDAAGTPFVFTFEYVGSWELQDPLEGPGGMIQGISSPVVTVDGETESAGLTVGQKFEALTEAEVQDAVSGATDGEYARSVVVAEPSFGGETIQIIGFEDVELPTYQTWLPHGDDEARYYELTMMLNSSILRQDDEGESQTLCLESTVVGVETVRQSLAPNPETTIAEVREQ